MTDQRFSSSITLTTVVNLVTIDLFSFRYNDDRVVGLETANAVVLPSEELEHQIDTLVGWVSGLRTGTVLLGQRPIDPSVLLPGFTDEFSETGGITKWEINIGDLTAELEYDTAADEWTITNSVFDLRWTDFLYFVERLTQVHRILVDERFLLL